MKSTLLLRHCVNYTQQKQGNGGRVREGGEKEAKLEIFLEGRDETDEVRDAKVERKRPR